MKLSHTPTFNTNFRSNKTDSNQFYNKYRTNYTAPFHKEVRESLATYFKQNESIQQCDIKGFAGHGGLTVIFDLGEKGILKCSKENPLEFRTHNPEFDIPFLSKPKKINNFYITQEIKADTKATTQQDCLDVINRMSKEGYEPSRDFSSRDLRQVGIYKDKAYLLDTRCAMPKPDKFSLGIYNFCNRNQRVFYPQKIDFEHIDETPRPNLTIKKSLQMVKKIMKDNFKHGMPICTDGIGGIVRLIFNSIKYKLF